MNHPHGDLVLSGVTVLASPNFDIPVVKFDSEHTFQDHVRGIVSPCLLENSYFEVCETYICEQFYVTLLLSDE